MRILCDVNILVRANENSFGPARTLLLALLEKGHVLLISNEIMVELARVLRYPRLQKLFGLSEEQIYSYVQFLREIAQLVVPDTTLSVPIRDAKDIVVLQTAVSGEAAIICTVDKHSKKPRRWLCAPRSASAFVTIQNFQRGSHLHSKPAVRNARCGAGLRSTFS